MKDETCTEWQFNWANLLQKQVDISKTWPAADCGQIPIFCGTESVYPTRNQRSVQVVSKIWKHKHHALVAIDNHTMLVRKIIKWTPWDYAA